MALTPGTHLGPYEILSPLGAGGMGEVYRARDTKLNRDVALKILPGAFVNDPDRMARFTREAQTLAALNHPNIAHIHGLEESGGVRALVMELVEGEDLAERLARGPIPLDDALPIARQIAEAVEAAHEQGIVHRDLKPANVKVRPDGMVKVLDFGLAKAMDSADAGSASMAALTNSPTLMSPAMMTGVGMILGTAAYMAPEQAKGRPADKRSDVWAFGCVLFEMLVGTRAFEGDDVSDTLAAILRGEPNWTALPANTPAPIRRLLRRCLEKDRRRRLADIADARLDVDEALGGALSGAVDIATPSPIAKPASKANRWLPIAGAALVTGLVATSSTWIALKPAPQAVLRLIAMPTDGSPVGDISPAPDVAITPDGTRIVYQVGTSLANIQMFVRSLDQLDATRVEGRSRNPFISPDGQWVGYFDASTMKKVAISGGPPVTICEIDGGANARGATWGADDTIIFGMNDSSGLFQVGAGGGKPVLVAKPDPSKGEVSYVLPEFLPGDRAVLFAIGTGVSGSDTGRIAVRDLKTSQTKILIQGGTSPKYVASGHLVYAAAGGLRAVPFDAGRLEVRGNAVPVVDHVAMKGRGFLAAAFAMARNGTLVYRSGDALGSQQLRTLVWVDRQGHEEALGVPPRAYSLAHVSPDGTKLALDIRDQENDIWLWDLVRHGPLVRLTFDPGFNRGGVWSPDGRRIAFSAERDGTENIYLQAADGTGTAQRVTDGRRSQIPSSFTPDGTRLLFAEPTSFPFDVGIANLTGDRHSALLLHGPQSEHNGEVSPDGKWLAYQSNESKENEIYVRPFPNIDGGRWQVSIGGGSAPLWARSGRELFYSTGVQGGLAAKIVAVSVQPGTTLTFGTPQVVVDGPYLTPLAGRAYDVSPDGKRFLMIKDATPAPTSSAPTRPSQLVVVVNWFEELKQRVPTK